jgi:hypothetical protein
MEAQSRASIFSLTMRSKMDNQTFPSNSHKTRATEEPKQVPRVTHGEVRTRKKGLGTRFRETFFGGSGKTALQIVVGDVLVPAAQDMVINSVQEYLERTIKGDGPRRRGRSSAPTAQTIHTEYHRFAQSGQQARTLANTRGRPRHEFDEVLLDSWAEAQDVLEALVEMLERYNSVSVADLYASVGLRSKHTDQKWGWYDLQGSRVRRTREGFLLDIPDPVPLD